MDQNGLRDRKPLEHLDSTKELASSDDSPVEEGDKEKKTSGRTPDGTGECTCLSSTDTQTANTGICNGRINVPVLR